MANKYTYYQFLKDFPNDDVVPGHASDVALWQ